MREDKLPWYRQFWPWFLIALPGSAVVASLYTLSLAVQSSDSLVVDATDGMDVVTKRHLAAEAAAASLGLVATVAIDAHSGAIGVSLDGTPAAGAPAALRLLFSHPTLAARDRQVTLYRAPVAADGGPAWAGHLVTVPDGRWYLVLAPDGDTAQSWRLSGTWTGEEVLVLAPAGRARDAAG